jgi:hypothetical protein
MGQTANILNLHLLQNKSSNSYWYVDYNFYGGIFQEDLLIYLYIRSQSNIKYSIFKRKHIYQIEIIKVCIYRINRTIILNLQLIYFKNKFIKSENIKSFTKKLLLQIRNVFTNKNKLLIFYKVGKHTAKFIALRIAVLLEKRIKFKSKLVEKLIKSVLFSGIRVVSKGRLGLIDRAKKEQILFGSVPLQVFTYSIDYGLIIINSKRGLQSIKVWVF